MACYDFIRPRRTFFFNNLAMSRNIMIDDKPK